MPVRVKCKNEKCGVVWTVKNEPVYTERFSLSTEKEEKMAGKYYLTCPHGHTYAYNLPEEQE